MSASNSTTHDDENGTVPDGYEHTGKTVYARQDDVTDAFLAKKYPPKTGGVMESSSGNFQAQQFNDGSGRIMHYSTVETIRTQYGDIFVNEQCFGSGFAHCSTPSTRDPTQPGSRTSLPLTFIEEMLPSDATVDIFDLTGVNEDDWGRVAVFGDSGHAVFIGRDTTQKRGEGGLRNQWGFHFTKDDYDAAGGTAVWHKPRNVTRTLVWPRPVLEAADDAVYNGDLSYLDGPEEDWPFERQGEWFLIPYPDAEPSVVHRALRDARRGDGSLDRSHTDAATGSHVARERAVRTLRECEACGATSLHLPDTGYDGGETNQTIECNECDHVHYVTIVRGTFRHIQNEHDILNLGETWHLAVRSEVDAQQVGNLRTQNSGRRRSRRRGAVHD